MNLGEAIGIYFGVAIFIILAFCLITIFFRYRYQKEYDEIVNQKEPIENSQNKDNCVDEEIQQLINKKLSSKLSPTSDIPINFQMVEMGNLRQPLGPTNNFNIYAAKPQNKDEIYRKIAKRTKQKAEDNKQTPKSKSTKIEVDILQEQQYNPLKFYKKSSMLNNNDIDDITNHKFVGKIVRYSRDRIEIIENNVKSITKISENKIAEKTKTKYNVITKQSSQFQDFLEVYGFQLQQYSCYKYTTYIQIPKMKLKEVYFISNLKYTETKQLLSNQQYQDIKQILKKNM